MFTEVSCHNHISSGSVQKVGLSGIINPLMIIVTVEEAVNKDDAWNTLLLINDREAPREAPKKMQN